MIWPDALAFFALKKARASGRNIGKVFNPVVKLALENYPFSLILLLRSESPPHSSVPGLPIAKFQSNSQTVLIVPQRGGHFGFVEGFFPFGPTWMDRTLRQLLKALRNSRELWIQSGCNSMNVNFMHFCNLQHSSISQQLYSNLL